MSDECFHFSSNYPSRIWTNLLYFFRYFHVSILLSATAWIMGHALHLKINFSAHYARY